MIYVYIYIVDTSLKCTRAVADLMGGKWTHALFVRDSGLVNKMFYSSFIRKTKIEPNTLNNLHFPEVFTKTISRKNISVVDVKA